VADLSDGLVGVVFDGVDCAHAPAVSASANPADKISV
jgi:hypothetical protein